VGCALSHVGVWRRVEAAAAPAAVVIEDDVVFAPGFAALLRAALDEVTAPDAAGCNPMQPRPQPYAPRLQTPCSPGCSPLHPGNL
jgi:hypothetical protein